MSEDELKELMGEGEKQGLKISPETHALLQSIADRLGISVEDVITRAVNALIDREAPRLEEVPKTYDQLLEKVMRGEKVDSNTLLTALLLSELRERNRRSIDPQSLAELAIVSQMFQRPASEWPQILSFLQRVVESKSLDELKQTMREFAERVEGAVSSLQSPQTGYRSLEDEIAEAVRDALGGRIKDLVKEMLQKGVLKEEEIVDKEGKINIGKIVDEVLKFLRSYGRALERSARRTPPPSAPPIIQEVKERGEATPRVEKAPHGEKEVEGEATETAIGGEPGGTRPTGAEEAPPRPEEGSGVAEPMGHRELEEAKPAPEADSESSSPEELGHPDTAAKIAATHKPKPAGREAGSKRASRGKRRKA